MSAIINAAVTPGQALPDLVGKLLSARQKSLVLYQKLATLKPLAPSAPMQSHLLQRFQDALMDYLALGPFQVFQALEDQPANSPYRRARQLGRQLYARIARTTQTALAFYDRYHGDLSRKDLATLSKDLSRLGEQLAVRIELEDQIVAAVRQSERPIPA